MVIGLKKRLGQFGKLVFGDGQPGFANVTGLFRHPADDLFRQHTKLVGRQPPGEDEPGIGPAIIASCIRGESGSVIAKGSSFG